MKSKNAVGAVRWVLQAADRNSLVKLEDGADDAAVPQEGEVVTRPFLVDAGSRLPVPVRVVQRLVWHHGDAPTFVVVVGRADQEHAALAPAVPQVPVH